MSFYKFNPDDVYRFKNHIGYKARKDGDELKFVLCPYCNGGYHNDKDTFSISLVTGQFECKRASCGVRGNMLTLARDFNFDLGRDVNAYYNINNYNVGKYKRFRDAHRTIESKDSAIEYMKSRGISEEITKRYEITVKPDQDKVLIFPFKDEKGNLQYIKYRNTEYNKGDAGSKEWSEKGCKPILFGMNHCEDFGTLVITEGQIDSLSLAEAGIKNAVSVPTGKNGFTWRPYCWDWITKFDEIVVFGDCENGEITLEKEISSSYPKRVRVVRTEDYQGHKDANELLQKCGKEALINAVNNAVPKVSLRIKNLADVEAVDLTNIKAYSTGFKNLDYMLSGGFRTGQLIIMTGKCGEGKSTTASMIIAYMIEQNLKCFCYSGELQDFTFKAWMDAQIVGTEHLTEEQIEKVNKWYDGKCFIYDNSALIDESDEMFTAMEQAVKDLGVNVVLIDNLMIAMEDKPQEDLYRQQSSFVGRLAKFAKGFNVIIILVAHPKKGIDKSNDSISGSGDITNKADIVLRYERGTKENKDFSFIKVTKNRVNGSIHDVEDKEDGIKCIYIPEGRQVVQEGGMAPHFSWDGPQKVASFAEFRAIDRMEEIPF